MLLPRNLWDVFADRTAIIGKFRHNNPMTACSFTALKKTGGRARNCETGMFLIDDMAFLLFVERRNKYIYSEKEGGVSWPMRLLALFTHIHLFWVAGLIILALIRLLT